MCSTHRAHSESLFKDTALRELGVVKTITKYMTEHSEGLCVNFKILVGEWGDSTLATARDEPCQ